MNRSERLVDMIRYLNNLEFFNLNDLMERYQISKSTALRDIESLEQLGMPIYVEYGRYGRYGILKNRLLSPIMFTLDEVYALYFAMLTLKSYQSTPFHLSVEQLHEKFEKCLSPKQLEQIEKMKKVLQLEINPHHHESRFLDQILQSILNESSCTIQYSKGDEKTSYTVQFFKISAKFGQWYAAGIDLKTNQYRVFRCDRITDLTEDHSETAESAYSIDELINRSIDIYRSKARIEFKVEIEEQAKDLFYKEHYPSMKIELGDRTVIRGFYSPGEEMFIADYFLKFGQHVVSVKPVSLGQLIKDRIEQLHDHFKNL